MTCGTISWASMFHILGTNLWEEVGLRGWYSVGSLCLRCYRGPVWVGLLGNHQLCKCEVFREELQNNFEWLCKMFSSINNLTMIECESKLCMMLVNLKFKKKSFTVERKINLLLILCYLLSLELKKWNYLDIYCDSSYSQRKKFKFGKVVKSINSLNVENLMFRNCP